MKKAKKIGSLALATCMLAGMLALTAVPASAASEHLYSTNFDSYTSGSNATVTETLVNLNSAYGTLTWSAATENVVGATVDAAHGTSMKLISGDYKYSYFTLPRAINSGKLLISFEYQTPATATVGISCEGNNGPFSFALSGLNAKSDPASTDFGTQSRGYTTDAQPGYNQWMKVEIYVDFTTEKCAFYINGKAVDAPRAFIGSSSSKFVQNIYLRKRSGGDAFIDNILVRTVDAAPYNPDPYLNEGNTILSASTNSVTLNFTDMVDPAKLTDGNVVVKKVTDSVETEVAGVSLSNASAYKDADTANECLLRSAVFLL